MGILAVKVYMNMQIYVHMYNTFAVVLYENSCFQKPVHILNICLVYKIVAVCQYYFRLPLKYYL